MIADNGQIHRGTGEGNLAAEVPRPVRYVDAVAPANEERLPVRLAAVRYALVDGEQELAVTRNATGCGVEGKAVDGGAPPEVDLLAVGAVVARIGDEEGFFVRTEGQSVRHFQSAIEGEWLPRLRNHVEARLQLRGRSEALAEAVIRVADNKVPLPALDDLIEAVERLAVEAVEADGRRFVVQLDPRYPAGVFHIPLLGDQEGLAVAAQREAIGHVCVRHPALGFQVLEGSLIEPLGPIAVPGQLKMAKIKVVDRHARPFLLTAGGKIQAVLGGYPDAPLVGVSGDEVGIAHNAVSRGPCPRFDGRRGAGALYLRRMRAKKSYGQHFLNNEHYARQIAEALQLQEQYKEVLEVGPGQGMLTKHLLDRRDDFHLRVAEADRDMVSYLQVHYPQLKEDILEGDFLKLDLEKVFAGRPFGLIGNFPYNISSQILIKLLDNYRLIPEMVGMFQKEVADRVLSGEGNKVYGVIGILVQSRYVPSLCFNVSRGNFSPPPRVESAVIRLVRRERPLVADEHYSLFKHVVKSSFGQRRKMLRNSLKAVFPAEVLAEDEIFQRRPEQLSVEELVTLTERAATLK